MIDFASAAETNRRRSRVLVLTLAGIALVLGLTVDAAVGGLSAGGFPVVTLVSLVGVAATVVVARSAGDRLVLLSLGAVPADPRQPEQGQLIHVAHEMSVASGLPPPQVLVISDPAPNALATGSAPEHASIAVTTGLLEKLDRAQTQAVVAHEMGHIGNRDTQLGVLIAILVGSIALLADVAWRLRYTRPRSSGKDGRRNAGIALVLPILLLLAALAPLASRLIAFAVSREREFLADATAVDLTRNPLALASALEAIAETESPTKSGTRGTAHLFFVCPQATWAEERSGPIADLWATHPPIRQRIARLRAMATDIPDAPLRA